MFDFTKKVIISSLVLAGTLSADYKEVSKVEIAQMEQLELFKRAQIKINKAYDTGSLYILNISVQGNPDEIYLTKDKKLVLAGDVIDASNGMKITSPADVAPIRGKEAFVYGTGTEEYFLFTDPECKYCKMLESYLPKIQDKVKIRVFYYPLDSHTNAKDLSLYIMSQKTADKKISAMFDSTTIVEKAKSMKYTPAELEKLEKQLDEQIQIGMKLNVQGTPTLFDKDGKNIIWVNLLEKFGIEVK
jgi:thiol:disulfide interchange protein DsbC